MNHYASHSTDLPLQHQNVGSFAEPSSSRSSSARSSSTRSQLASSGHARSGRARLGDVPSRASLPESAHTEGTDVCLIYCRVSSERQVREGNGISSQEKRCRDYAAAKGLHVEDVFYDEGVSGAVLERPGMQNLLRRLKDLGRSRQVVVIVDDISRVARDVKTHVSLRASIEANGGRLESPSFAFENNAMGEFVELIFAGIAQYGRTGNREQVINRQRARLESGFWTFPAPPGYTYCKHPVHKKLLVPDPVPSRGIRQVLEAFAAGRFNSKRDMVRFLQEKGYFERVRRWPGSKYDNALERILDNIWFYAGFIEYAPWGISRRPAQHQAIISESIALQVEERLQARPTIALSKNRNEEYVLRNFVRCSACGRPLTASSTKGGRFKRYHCYRPDCELYGKNIPCHKLHADFEDLLMQLTASDQTMKVIRELAGRAWKIRLEEWQRQNASHEARLLRIQEESGSLVRRLSKIENETVAQAIESEIAALEEERKKIERALEKGREKQPDFEEAFQKVGTVLQNPYLLWKRGSLDTKKLVHRIVFTSAPTYWREGGFGTIDLTLPYLISRQLRERDSRLVDLSIKNWHQFACTLIEWSDGPLWDFPPLESASAPTVS